MKFFLTLALCALTLPIWGQTTIFQQNFNSSTTLSDYFSSTPSSSQFNMLRSSGSGTTVTITNNKLQISKISTNSGGFARATDFSPTPTIVAISFKLAVPSASMADANVAYLYIGNNFLNDLGFEANADTYARLSFNTTNTNGEFIIRDITNTTNSLTFTGEKHLKWVLNNSGSAINYISPNNTTESLANDKADLWVEGTLIFNDVNVQTSSANLTDIKFLVWASPATFTMDDLVIQEGSINLPVELTQFTSKPTNTSITLYWKTASETQNDHFDIEHSTTGSDFKKIGFVKGNGTTPTGASYKYTHETPSVGNNFYRLKQVDVDEKYEYSKIIEIPFGNKTFSISPSLTDDFIQLTTSDEEGKTYILFNFQGQILGKGYFQGTKRLDVSSLPNGIYFIKTPQTPPLKFVKN